MTTAASNQTRQALLSLRRKRRVARFSRAGLDYRGGYLEGYVVGVGRDLVLIHRVNPMMVLDGYAVWHIAHITVVDTSFASRGFIEAALRLRGQNPHGPAPTFPLTSASDVLLAAQRSFALVTVHLERRFRDSCWIGHISQVSESSVVLREITPSATWDPEHRYRLSGITAIEFGGAYEDALASVAQVEPNPSLQRTRYVGRPAGSLLRKPLNSNR